MNPHQNTSNVTGTGIAVALAVIIALGLLFFGSRIFTFMDHGSNNLASTTSQAVNTQSTTSNTNSTMNDTGTTSTPLAGIPANPTTLMSKDNVVGTGAEAKAGDTVTVNYVGMLTNGNVFDASANHGTTGFTFPLGAGQVIKGWDEGVVGMKVGGKRELVIPASLGYGAQAAGPIPANSTLIFEIELLNVQPGTK